VPDQLRTMARRAEVMVVCMGRIVP
jgi:hypothetical protein